MENIIPIQKRRRPGRPRGDGGSSERSIQSVERALAILELLADHADGMPFTELSAALEMPAASTHRLLRTLSDAGYVREQSDTGRYLLGTQLLRLAGRILHRRTQLRALARGYLQELVDRTGETANLATIDGGSASFLDQVQSDRLVRGGTFLRAPLHCSAAGKSLLAFQPEATREEIVERLELTTLTAHTITDRVRLRAELERVRALGYSVDDEEMEVGSRCIGAPILLGGEAVAAISISGPTTRISGDVVRPLSAIVREVSERLSTSVADQFPGLAAGELLERFVG
jgi:DNA-binding IclR family transcriptional regulator